MSFDLNINRLCEMKLPSDESDLTSGKHPNNISELFFFILLVRKTFVFVTFNSIIGQITIQL